MGTTGPETERQDRARQDRGPSKCSRFRGLHPTRRGRVVIDGIIRSVIQNRLWLYSTGDAVPCAYNPPSRAIRNPSARGNREVFTLSLVQRARETHKRMDLKLNSSGPNHTTVYKVRSKTNRNRISLAHGTGIGGWRSGFWDSDQIKIFPTF